VSNLKLERGGDTYVRRIQWQRPHFQSVKTDHHRRDRGSHPPFVLHHQKFVLEMRICGIRIRVLVLVLYWKESILRDSR